jgi:hypothetical protein
MFRAPASKPAQAGRQNSDDAVTNSSLLGNQAGSSAPPDAELSQPVASGSGETMWQKMVVDK